MADLLVEKIEMEPDQLKDGLTPQFQISIKSSLKPTYPSSSNKTNPPAEKFKALSRKFLLKETTPEESKSDYKTAESGESKG